MDTTTLTQSERDLLARAESAVYDCWSEHRTEGAEMILELLATVSPRVAAALNAEIARHDADMEAQFQARMKELGRG